MQHYKPYSPLTDIKNIGDFHPSIHYTGSVVGMKKLGYWDKNDVCVRIGAYIYNLSIRLSPSQVLE